MKNGLTFYITTTYFVCSRKQGDHNHLFIRQGTGLQGQAVFRTKLSFRPHSTDSFTHRKILSSLADRSLKTSAVKVLSQVMKDPDTKREELFKVTYSSASFFDPCEKKLLISCGWMVGCT